MGLLTGLALGAALGGGLIGGSKLAGKGKSKIAGSTSTTTANGPSTSGDLGVPTPPKVDTAADQAAAVGAGNRQRKKAAIGELATRPLPKPGALAGVRLNPKHLSGY